jgi:hypothetical protein
MPGDVDKPEITQVRKAEVDGNAAALFFFQTIRVDTSEGADQRRLAVVDVSGGAYDERNAGFLLLKNIGR